MSDSSTIADVVPVAYMLAGGTLIGLGALIICLREPIWSAVRHALETTPGVPFRGSALRAPGGSRRFVGTGVIVIGMGLVFWFQTWLRLSGLVPVRPVPAGVSTSVLFWAALMLAGCELILGTFLIASRRYLASDTRRTGPRTRVVVLSDRQIAGLGAIAIVLAAGSFAVAGMAA
jgi:hypothetical protein